MDKEEEEKEETAEESTKTSFCRVSNSAQKPLSQTKNKKKLLKNTHKDAYLEKVFNP
jgi:hypothetical protein